MLSILVGGNLIICMYFTTRFMSATKIDALVLGLGVSFLSIQWMPSIVEGVYWYNGAMNYGLFYFLLQILVCTLTEYLFCKEKGKQIVFLIISGVIAFIIEDGNHVTAFVGLLFVLLLWGVAIVRKNKIVGCSVVTLVTISGFLLNIMSPGTKIRADAVGDVGGGITKTIYFSIKQVVLDIKEWSGIHLILIILCLTPILFQLASNIRKDWGYTFKYPLLVLVFLFGISYDVLSDVLCDGCGWRWQID